MRKVARELKRNLMRPGDFIGRYGGEEFCVVLPDTNSAGATLLAEKLRDAVESLNIAHPASSAADHVTVSIGYTTEVVKNEARTSDLIDKADQALYRAKDTGRNKIEMYELK